MASINIQLGKDSLSYDASANEATCYHHDDDGSNKKIWNQHLINVVEGPEQVLHFLSPSLIQRCFEEIMPLQ
jgi:hypothetical protein